MTNDKQVEEWRDQFEKIYAVKDIGAYFSEKDKVYCFYSTSDSHNQTKMLRLLAINGSYDGWMTAKRSQPVVVLPNDTEIEKLAKSTAAEYKFDHEDDSTMFIKSFICGGLVASDEIVRRMIKAGIAYTVDK